MRDLIPSSIAITGASGGIGGALAEAYARPGVALTLLGRDAERLASVATRCRTLGAEVRVKALDLRDRAALRAWLAAADAERRFDLLIANAGVNTHVGPGGAGERWESVEELLEVNVLGAIASVDAVLAGMRARRRGQIALISSLAAYYGLPLTPSYCASKAALKAYGEGIRRSLAPTGIRVSVVMPGFVESKMCREFPGPKPFLWPAARAARAIQRGLRADRARISFPFPLSLATWSLAVLPSSISGRLAALLYSPD